MSRFEISNWPFATKFAVPTAVSLSMIGVLSGVSYFELKGQVDRTDNIVDKDFSAALTLSRANSQIQNVNGKLYQLLTYQAADISDGENPATQVANLATEVEQTIADLEAYRKTVSAQQEANAVQAIEEELVTYKDTIGVVASMMEIDFGSAVSFAEPFAENYESLLKQFDQLVDDTIANSRASADAGAKAAQNANLLLAATSLIALSAAGFLAFFVGSATRRSIQEISDATASLAGGDLSIDMKRLERGDELSAIVTALDTFKNNALERNELAARERAELEAREKRTKRIEGLIHEFELDSGQLLELVGSASDQLRSTAEGMRANADDTTNQSEAAAGALNQAAQDVHAVAAASEELSASIQEIANSVGNSVDAVNSAASKADKANATMRDLTESARQIDDVVKLINDIAEQTNLLALNATIEAARAGEAGKGFAVVANEVKTLANQTSQATSRVATSVKDIQAVTDTVAAAMSEIIETITSVTSISSEISQSVQQQGMATEEIAISVSRVSQGTGEVSQTMSDVRTSAVDTGSSADDVLCAASALQEQAVKMRESVGRFLSGIRAA